MHDPARQDALPAAQHRIARAFPFHGTRGPATDDARSVAAPAARSRRRAAMPTATLVRTGRVMAGAACVPITRLHAAGPARPGPAKRGGGPLTRRAAAGHRVLLPGLAL